MEQSNHSGKPVSRQQAIKVFFQAVNNDDPCWDSLMEDFYDEETDSFPTQWEVGRALGFSNAEMEEAAGVEKGRLEELGL